MNSIRNTVISLAALASLGIATSAFAQGTPGTPPAGLGHGIGPMGGHGPMGAPGARGPGGNFDPSVMIDARMAHLKSTLKITTAQEANWDAFVTQVKAQAQAMKAARPAAPTTPVAAPERMTQHIAAMQANLDGLSRNVLPAMKNVYDILTPEQKAIADKQLGKPFMGRGRPGL